jgi:hypothetical protein
MMRKTTVGRGKRGTRKSVNASRDLHKKAAARPTLHKREADVPQQTPLPVGGAAVERADERHGMIEDAEMLPPTRGSISDDDQIDWVEP